MMTQTMVDEMTKEEFLLRRRALGLSQEQMGQVLGFSRRMITHWERGTKPIPRVVELALVALEQQTDDRSPGSRERH
jgi:transcriptional regulator with XRE-family HTH domain